MPGVIRVISGSSVESCQRDTLPTRPPTRHDIRYRISDIRYLTSTASPGVARPGAARYNSCIALEISHCYLPTSTGPRAVATPRHRAHFPFARADQR